MLTRTAALACALVLLLAGTLPGYGQPSAGGQQQMAGSRGEAGDAAEAGNPAPADPAPAATPAPLTGVSELEGLRVRAVRFEAESPLDARSFEDLLAQKQDEPLHRAKVQSSLHALYATGRFADIRVEAEQASQDEVTLVFIAEENYFVGAVTVQGVRRPPTEGQLVNATRLRLGELFTEQRLRAAVERMQRVLSDNGYYNAAIQDQRSYHAATRQVDIHFIITAGEPAQVGRVMVEGATGMTEYEVQRRARLRPGDRVTLARQTDALHRLRRHYQKQNRLEAQVAVADRRHNPENNTVDYLLRIERGPTVEIEVEGARLRRGLLRRYVPVFEEHAVDDDLLNEGRRNLRDYFQTQGYFHVDVDFHQVYQAEADRRVVIYTVDRGDRQKLEEISIEGNRSFPDDLIRERLIMQPAGIVFSHGRFSQSMLARDIEAVEAMYRANGFHQVAIRSDVHTDGSGRMRVRLHIEEGPRTRVASLTLTGNETLPAGEFANLLTTIEGQAYSDYNVARDRENLIAYYFNRGFPHASMEWGAEPVAGDPTLMDVSYRIYEGERIFTDQVLVAGYEFTKPFVVHREVEVEPGTPLSQIDMLETQRKLYDLGLFSLVDVAVQNPEGAARRKNVLVQMREGPRYTFNYGVGLEVQTGTLRSDPQEGVDTGRTGVSPRFSFDVTRLNFRGRDHTITFRSRVGRLQQRLLLTYEAPRWFDHPDLHLSFTTFFDTTRDVLTFTSERLEGSVQALHRYSLATTLLYRFTYRRVQARDLVTGFSPDEIPLITRPVRVGLPSFTYVRDRRNDPINATRGNYNTLDFGVASGIFGSEASFSRLLFQNSTYHTFGRGNRYVFARSTRVGVQNAFGDEDFIPFPERFFAGGGSTHRGFGINQAGPRDLNTGLPIGGGALFLNNLELRMPPMLLPFVEDNLSFAFFHDAGNIFSRPGEMLPALLRWRQRRGAACGLEDRTAPCDFDFFSHAIGGGLRYNTPIGPVRLDIGYNLNPPHLPRTGERLGRVNFFFSIGQTF